MVTLYCTKLTSFNDTFSRFAGQHKNRPHTCSSMLPMCINTHGQCRAPMCPKCAYKILQIFSLVLKFALEFWTKFNEPQMLPLLQYQTRIQTTGKQMCCKCRRNVSLTATKQVSAKKKSPIWILTWFVAVPTPWHTPPPKGWERGGRVPLSLSEPFCPLDGRSLLESLACCTETQIMKLMP